MLNRIRSANRAAIMDNQECLPDGQVIHAAKLSRPDRYLQKPWPRTSAPASACTFEREQAGLAVCESLFLLHEAQIAHDGEQPFSDRRFGVAGKIKKRIKFILVPPHLR
jgi:hypothetical protein